MTFQCNPVVFRLDTFLCHMQSHVGVVWLSLAALVAPTVVADAPKGRREVQLPGDEVHVTLRVTPFRFEGGAGTGGTNPINFTTRAYNGQVPGPTIRVKQGGTLRITLVNALEGPAAHPSAANTFGAPNTTNLHLHGLHISPENISDNVFRAVLPGQSAEYEYHIPADHPAGTFWYHPHLHGSSALQQGGGMAGALIVQPVDPTYLPPELAAMGEGEVLVLQHLCFYTNGKHQSPNPYVNHMNVHAYSGDRLDPRPAFKHDPATANGYYLVNGVYQPTIVLATGAMQPGSFKLFRFVGASVSAFLELGIVPHRTAQSSSSNSSSSSSNGSRSISKASANGHGCDIWVVAKDGIYVDTAYHNQRPLLVPGSRLDVAVRCNASGSYDIISQPDAPYDTDLEPNTIVYSGVLATFVVAGAQTTMRPPSQLPARPAYMADLSRSAVGPAQQFDVIFYTPGGAFTYGPPYPPYQINGQSFHDKDTFVRNLTLGRIEEWQVQIDANEMDSSNHPFHLHVNPFQVVGIGWNNASVMDIRLGEWRDTLPIPGDQAPSGASLTLRFMPDTFTGRALLHCHMTPHIDLGMAAVTHIYKGDG